MKKLKIMTIFGTRPEGIKMAPIIKEMEKRENIESIVCITAQHREMLDSVLDIFNIKVDYDLNIFKKGQTLTEITNKALAGLEDVIRLEKPDIVLVQGDTTTVFAGALAAFYQGVKVGHVEAGLRSGNILSPYPEEANRKLTGILTKYHFAPTEKNRNNLLREGYHEDSIYVTGNTVIDSLKYVIKKDYIFQDELLNKIDFKNKRVILLTSHRRENIGQAMENIFSGVDYVINNFPDVEVIFPMHLNPRVRELAKKYLGDNSKVHLIEPLEYEDFTNLINLVYLVVTDSGGIQEEAPSLGKPVLVVRRETERPEGIEAGTAKLVGTEYEDIVKELSLLLDKQSEYLKMKKAVNPYGDGTAAQKIISIIIKDYN